MTTPQTPAHTTTNNKRPLATAAANNCHDRKTRLHQTSIGRCPSALLIALALLVACQGEQPGESGPCAALIAPASAIPVDQCPVTEVSSASLIQRFDPLTGKNSQFNKATGKYGARPTTTPKANVKLSLWPVWNKSEPMVCRSCASVCDCMAIHVVSTGCSFVLGNRHMPETVSTNVPIGMCAGQATLPPGTVRCVQGQCVLMPASTTATRQ